MKNFEELSDKIRKIRESWGENSDYCQDQIDESIYSAVSEMVGEIIGENEDESIITEENGRVWFIRGQNELRKELRQKAIAYGLEIEKGKA